VLLALKTQLDALLQADRYVARSEYSQMLLDAQKTIEYFGVLKSSNMLGSYCRENGVDISTIEATISKYTNYLSLIESHNESFIRRAMVTDKQYLDRIAKTDGISNIQRDFEKKYGLNKIGEVPTKYKNGITTIYYMWSVVSNIDKLGYKTPYIEYTTDEETDGFIIGTMFPQGNDGLGTQFDTFEDVKYFISHAEYSNTDLTESLKEGKNVKKSLEIIRRKLMELINDDTIQEEFNEVWEDNGIYDSVDDMFEVSVHNVLNSLLKENTITIIPF
jgi:hypothetical protein